MVSSCDFVGLSKNHKCCLKLSWIQIEAAESPKKLKRIKILPLGHKTKNLTFLFRELKSNSTQPIFTKK